MNEIIEPIEPIAEADEVTDETAKEAEKKPEKTPLVILDAQAFMNEIGKLVGTIPEGKTLEGFYNYFYSAMKAKYIEACGRKAGGLTGSSADVIQWVEKYFSPEVKEGELVPEPKFDKVAIRKEKQPTPEEIAKKAAKDAEREAKRKEREEKKAKETEKKRKHEEMMKKWRGQQLSFDF